MSMELLEQYIADGDAESVNNLLSQQPQLAKQLTDQQVSPLMLSCYYKKPKVTEVILKYAGNLDLYEAAAAGKLEDVVRYIESRPDDVNKYADDGFTALGLACYFGHLEEAKYLVSKGAEVNLPSNNGYNVFPIHSACAGDYTDIAELLITNGAEVNVKQTAGVTPLHSAAQNGNLDLLILLLENGAEINARMEGGRMPADLARERGFSEIAEILS